ncbi:hypothetical protein HK405_002164, partial [Cladochytrium tenue]
IESLTLAVQCDPYLAVAYFQRGNLFFAQDLIGEAIADYNDALSYLRENLLIDYTQLGLPYKLFSAEISFNRGLCFAAMGLEEAALADFDDARRTRPLDAGQGSRYARIEEALDLGARAPTYCRPYEVRLDIMFRPPEAKIKNIKKKQYIGGNSYVVASTDPSDNLPYFTGTVLRMQSRAPVRKTAGPLDDSVTFAPGATLRRALSQRELDETFAPLLPSRPSVSDTRAATLSRMTSIG